MLNKKVVLNLIITGIPSILKQDKEVLVKRLKVLNLIITGMSSIHRYNNFDFYTKWMF